MLDGRQRMRKDNGRLAQLFVGLEGAEEEVEELGEAVSAVPDTLLVDPVACQEAVVAHPKQGEVGLAQERVLGVREVELVGLDEIGIMRNIILGRKGCPEEVRFELVTQTRLVLLFL